LKQLIAGHKDQFNAVRQPGSRVEQPALVGNRVDNLRHDLPRGFIAFERSQGGCDRLQTATKEKLPQQLIR